MSVRKSRKQKKQAPQKCSTTEDLTVAVTRPEDEQDYSELEKKAAAMYGFDIEADRRLDNEHWERRRRLRDRYQAVPAFDFMDIPEHEILELENLLQDIHCALYGSAKCPLDVDTAENLSDRTLSVITRLKERRPRPATL